MRYVPINCLHPGHLLASDLVLGENRFVLRQGAELTPQLISRLRTLGFQGVYIHDEISRNIQVTSILSDQLKSTMKGNLRHLYSCAKSGLDKRINAHLNGLDNIISDMVNEIVNNQNLMVNIFDLRTYDDYTFSHSLNVAVISVVIGSALGFDRPELHDLAMGAIVHDIGKVFIDKRIINKPDKLSDDEFSVVKRHSNLGYVYLSDKLESQRAKQVILTHHEHYDGGGYPFGLSGENIPVMGRIVCIADVYDALISDRPYRSALSPSNAFEYIMSQNGILFEPKIVEAFTHKVSPYVVGTCVRLSTDDIAIVVANHESCSLRPVVQILHNNTLTSECIDLAHDSTSLNITIKEIVDL